MMDENAINADNQPVCFGRNDLRSWKARFIEGLSALYAPVEAEAMFYWTAEEVSGMPKSRLLAEMGKPLSSLVSASLEKALLRLQEGEPVQYVFGKAYFAGLELEVGPGVLIPRPETEELFLWAVECVQSMVPAGKGQGCRVLDLCTGSGALALALASRLSQAEVWACDLSPIALDTARKNAGKLHLPVRFFRHDILEGRLPGDVPSGGLFHLMVSNPPYVLPSEKARMRSNVLDYEPDMALFVEEQDPLLYYRALSGIARAYLRPGGFFLAEINEAFPWENRDLLLRAGFEDVEVRQDFRGKYRMIRARQPLPGIVNKNETKS